MPNKSQVNSTQARAIVFFHAETPVHAGTGASLGILDLPIQRERITHWPIIQASGVKGALRGECKARGMPHQDPGDELFLIFGPEKENASDHAGALSCTDAQTLLFPIRSMKGEWVWATCPAVLARFSRLSNGIPGIALPPVAADLSTALISSENRCREERDDQSFLVLEEYKADARTNDSVTQVGQGLAKVLFPSQGENPSVPASQTPQERQARPDLDSYWRDKLQMDLVILPGDDFKDFVTMATEVQAHIALKYETKTVESGALWYEELLPTETIMWSLLVAHDSRSRDKQLPADDVIERVKQKLDAHVVQIGGDETVGKGFVRCRFVLGGP